MNISFFIFYRPDIFSDLLNSIFTYDWKGGARIDAATASLVEDIASANATFLPAALHMLVQSLLPAPGTVFTGTIKTEEEGECIVF